MWTKTKTPACAEVFTFKRDFETVNIIPQSYVLANKKPPIKVASTYEGFLIKTNIIITQKKPQQNAEASTTTAMISLLQCEGR